MPRKKTQEVFLAEVKAIWGDKLDFSKAVYVNNHTSVEVKCNECGEIFTPKPDNLLHHHGCPVCGGNKKMTRDMFINRACQIHSNHYDYSKVIWIDRMTEVVITCPTHGDFTQIPKNHLQGKGCMECAKLTMGSERLSLQRFIEKARQVHGDRYNYSLIHRFNPTFTQLKDFSC